MSEVKETHLKVNHIQVIADALNKVKKDVQSIEKTGRNPHFKYDYVEEGELVQKVRASMMKHGLVLVPHVEGQIQVITGERQSTVLFEQGYTLVHVSGAVWPFKLSVAAAGSDPGDKHVWKASTGANKYMLMRLLQLPTGDDPEAEHGTPDPRKRAPASNAEARRRNQRPANKSNSDTADLIAGHNPNDLCTPEMLKEAGAWGICFAKAEEAFGKQAIENEKSLRFKPMDECLSVLGHRSAKQLKKGELPQLMNLLKQWGMDQNMRPSDEDEEYERSLEEMI